MLASQATPPANFASGTNEASTSPKTTLEQSSPSCTVRKICVSISMVFTADRSDARNEVSFVLRDLLRDLGYETWLDIEQSRYGM